MWYRLRLLLAIFFLTTTSLLYAQSIINVVVVPNAPSCGNAIQINTSGTLSCANAIQTGNTFVVAGNSITVSIYEVIGQICLPAIIPYTDVQNIGILSGGNYNVTVNYYINGMLVSSFPTSFTVSGGGGVYVTPPIIICEGDSAFIHGEWQSDIGVYADTFFNGLCDSISVTFLNWYTDPSTSVDVDLCFGDSIFAAGAWQFSAGNFIDTLISVIGCDSVVTTKITLLLPSVESASVVICEGDSVFLGGNWQYNNGLYIDNLTNSQGCDSILSTNLTVIPDTYVSLSDSICNGDSIYLQGQWRTLAGVYFDTIKGGASCDSIIETNLEVIFTAEIILDTLPCIGDSVWFVNRFWTEDTTLLTSILVDNCEADYTINIDFIDCSTGIEPPVENNSGIVYPNPTHSNVFFQFDRALPLNIYLNDLHGRRLLQLQNGSNISNLPPAIYLIEYEYAEKYFYERIAIY